MGQTQTWYKRSGFSLHKTPTGVYLKFIDLELDNVFILPKVPNSAEFLQKDRAF
jgi:hypothetical protein